MAIKKPSRQHSTNRNNQPKPIPESQGHLISRFPDLTAKLTGLVGAAPAVFEYGISVWPIAAKAYPYDTSGDGGYLSLYDFSEYDDEDCEYDEAGRACVHILFPAPFPDLGEHFWEHAVTLSMSQIKAITELLKAYHPSPSQYLQYLLPAQPPKCRVLVICPAENLFQHAQGLLEKPSRYFYIKGKSEWVFPVDIDGIGDWAGREFFGKDLPKLARIDSLTAKSYVEKTYTYGCDLDWLFGDMPHTPTAFIAGLLGTKRLWEPIHIF